MFKNNKLESATGIISNWYLGLIPYAHITQGSVLLKTVFGFTPKHAVNRAKKMTPRNVSVNKMTKTTI